MKANTILYALTVAGTAVVFVPCVLAESDCLQEIELLPFDDPIIASIPVATAAMSPVMMSRGTKVVKTGSDQSKDRKNPAAGINKKALIPHRNSRSTVNRRS